ncbi:MAG TPA: hypothetical protein VG712_01845, partial [Gemmatimonadales bacterium]|nr:hypothetical protein [Gemmatimonadales bacterium]
DTAGYAVYVAESTAQGGMIAALRPVQLGEIAGNLITIRQGLTAGDRVIVRGATIVVPGQSVRVLP